MGQVIAPDRTIGSHRCLGSTGVNRYAAPAAEPGQHGDGKVPAGCAKSCKDQPRYRTPAIM
jgi:hypothetical protein